MNGHLTVGENLGDPGGIAIACEAYRRYVDAEHGSQLPVIDGFPSGQRFFLAYAQSAGFTVRAHRRHVSTYRDFDDAFDYRGSSY